MPARTEWTLELNWDRRIWRIRNRWSKRNRGRVLLDLGLANLPVRRRKGSRGQRRGGSALSVLLPFILALAVSSAILCLLACTLVILRLFLAPFRSLGLRFRNGAVVAGHGQICFERTTRV
jgi:hypothetical protein